MSQRGAQTYESRVLELTNQVAVIVREKEAAEESVRQQQRELAGKERENKRMREEMETLRDQVINYGAWVKERQVSISDDLIWRRLVWKEFVRLIFNCLHYSQPEVSELSSISDCVFPMENKRVFFLIVDSTDYYDALLLHCVFGNSIYL